MPREDRVPGLDRRLVTGDQVMIAHVYFNEGHRVSRATATTTSSSPTSSRARCSSSSARTDEETHTVHAGEVLVIPSDLPHRAVALEDTLDVDVFAPPRQDWLDGTDTYLRGGATS